MSWRPRLGQAVDEAVADLASGAGDEDDALAHGFLLVGYATTTVARAQTARTGPRYSRGSQKASRLSRCASTSARVSHTGRSSFRE